MHEAKTIVHEAKTIVHEAKTQRPAGSNHQPTNYAYHHRYYDKISVVSSYKEPCNNKPMYGYMLPNLSPSPNLYKVQSVYNVILCDFHKLDY